MLIREIKDNVSKWRHILCLLIGRCNIVKMSILPQMIDTFGVIPIKIIAEIFVDTEKLVLKFTWN